MDEAVMAQAQPDEGGAPSPPRERTTPCPKCGAIDWYWVRSNRHWRCRVCQRARDREYGLRTASLRAKSVPTCLTCGGPVPRGRGKGCPTCRHRALLALGERRLRERYPPEYVTLVQERLSEREREAFVLRLAVNRPAESIVRRPRPCALYPEISPGIDERLVRDGRDTDAACLEALAALPRHEQGTFYDRYLLDPAAAALWASVPAWKRPILNADPQDRLVWQIFVVLRLHAEWAAKYTEGGLATQGYQMAQLAGLLGSLKGDGPQRLGMVLGIFGGTLREGRDPGDVMHPPWPTGFGG